MNIEFIKEVGFAKWATRTAVRQYYKRFLRRDHSMKLPTGETMLLPISSKFASEAFVTRGNVDWGSEALLFDAMHAGGVFLDVGANIGYYSLYMLPKVRKVYAFEPDPRTRLLLERTLNAREQIEVVHLAVGQSSGTARFTLEPDGEVSHLADNRHSAVSLDIEVDVVTVDDFVSDRKISDVVAIKIDVEGFDHSVIAGSMATMRSYRPLILTEANAEGHLFDIADQTDYVICAYVHSLDRGAFLFTQILRQERTKHRTKMLLLVPEERLAAVKSQSARDR